jgi:integrase
MALVKRSNSKFWYVQFQINHITIIRSTRTADRKVAERVAAKIRAETHEQLVLGQRKPMTIEQALERFIATKAGTPNYRNLRIHQQNILRHFRGVLPLRALTSTMLEDYKSKRATAGAAPQTIKHGLNCLMGAVKKAKREGFDCPDVLSPVVKIPNGRIRFLSVQEERRLLAELDPTRQVNGLPSIENRSKEHQRFIQDNYDLIILLMDTGARYGEIANIQWTQINLEEKTISLWRPKVRNESVIFMTDRVHDILKRRKLTAGVEFLFTNKSGKKRGYSSIAIRKAFRRASLKDCTIHTLRHTHASRLIQNGLSVYEVRAILGHSDIKTTMRYAHLEEVKVSQKARDVINQISNQPIPSSDQI